MAIQAFAFLRLDYCNSLLYGISDGLVRRLQAAQNAVARLVTCTWRRDHISPVVLQLHWLYTSSPAYKVKDGRSRLQVVALPSSPKLR